MFDFAADRFAGDPWSAIAIAADIYLMSIFYGFVERLCRSILSVSQWRSSLAAASRAVSEGVDRVAYIIASFSQ